ncbi:hypothetical protein [Nonomuraea bangladeshensis]
MVRRGSKFGALRMGGAVVAYVDSQTVGKPLPKMRGAGVVEGRVN